jgi:L-alanine-DL-glutamate epimerase-like enolase superfamily enzyme
MKIRAIKVIVTCPVRDFFSVEIETDEGIYGVGDATQIEDIWQFFIAAHPGGEVL